MEQTELTVKEFALHERVHERTVRRWISDGAISIRRTPGGQIRIPVIDSRGRVLILSTSDAKMS